MYEFGRIVKETRKAKGFTQSMPPLKIGLRFMLLETTVAKREAEE